MSGHAGPRGVWLAVDPGRVRTGVAACDPEGVLAFPVTTVPAAQAVDAVATLVDERAAVGVLVGLAVSLSGEEGPAAEAGRRCARQLAAAITAPVFLVDERLTTVGAGVALRAGGHTTRSARAVIDQAAAANLLQGVLDAARSRDVDVGALLASGLGEQVSRTETA